MNTWQQALETSKIPRINYKQVLGMSFTRFLIKNQEKSNEEILRLLLLELRKPENRVYLNGLDLIKASDNIRISLSARRTEQKIYSNKNWGCISDGTF